MFKGNSKYPYNSTFAVGKQSLSSAVREHQMGKNLSQSQDAKSICFSQTSQEESSWETATSSSKAHRLDDAIARNRHADIMCTLKGIESALSKMSDSLIGLVSAMKECSSQILGNMNNQAVAPVLSANSGLKRKHQAQGSTSSDDFFTVDMNCNNSVSGSDSDDCLCLDKYMANKRYKGKIIV